MNKKTIRERRLYLDSIILIFKILIDFYWTCLGWGLVHNVVHPMNRSNHRCVTSTINSSSVWKMNCLHVTLNPEFRSSVALESFVTWITMTNYDVSSWQNILLHLIFFFPDFLCICPWAIIK